MCGLFFPFSCCYVVILVWSLILSGIILEALVLSLRCRGSCLIYPKTTDAFLIAFLFSLRAKEEKERNEKKVTYSLLYYSFFFLLHAGQFGIIEVSCVLDFTRALPPDFWQLGNLGLGPRRPEIHVKVVWVTSAHK